MPLSVRTTAPLRAQSQSLAKPLATSTAHQSSSKANAKSKIPPTPLDTPDLEAGPSRKAKQAAVVNGSDDGHSSSSLPDSPVTYMHQKADKNTTFQLD
ncbi:hypothetical protein FRC11_007890 [Ceratobasidium sp. 423]|nr:hypothetical protein FRC11_007890 [Ceratobasidium sp. 423]